MSETLPQLPDGSSFFTADVMSKEEAMKLPLKDRPLCYRLSSEMYHAVFEAVGAASMCWKPRPSSETFSSEEAARVATDLCFTIANEIESSLASKPDPGTDYVNKSELEALQRQLAEKSILLDRANAILNKITRPARPSPYGEYRQELFNYVSAEFDYTMLESQMADLDRIIFDKHPDLTGARRLLLQEGEHTLLESAQNRMREYDIMRDRVLKLYAGLSKVKESFNMIPSALPEAELDALLTINTTDGVWLEKTRYTLGLLKAARAHVAGREFSGSLPNALDAEIEKMEKLLPRDQEPQNE